MFLLQWQNRTGLEELGDELYSDMPTLTQFGGNDTFERAINGNYKEKGNFR